MNIFQNIARMIMKTRPNSTGMVFDFSMLSVEDAIILMFMLLTNDSKKDMKDILEAMEATRRRRRAAREAANARRTMLAEARKARIEETLRRRRTSRAATVRRRAMRAEMRKARREETFRRRRAAREAREKRRAQMLADRHEQRKKRRRLTLLTSGIFFIIIGAVVVKYYFSPPSVIPTEPPVPTVAAHSGPADGTLMAWVDGSTLVFHNGLWIYRSEVTNYQFSLCVEAGNCQSPGEIIGPIDSKQEYFNSPAQIIGPIDSKQKYCAWAGGGRLPTEAEASTFPGSVFPHPVQNKDLTITNDTPPTPATDDVSLTGILIGLLLPGTENGIRCVVDAPTPMAPACETSAFYLNGPPVGTDHTVTEAGRFCQKGTGYVTLDINLSDGGILQSVTGDCQVVGDNRILCSEQSGPSGDGQALILVNGLLPAVQRDGLAPAGQMQCLPGYEANSDSPSQCGFGELLPAVQNDSGFALSNEAQLAGGASLVVYQPNFMQNENLDLDPVCPPGFTVDGVGICVYRNPAYDSLIASDCFDNGGVWVLTHDDDGRVDGGYCDVAPPASVGDGIWAQGADGNCQLGWTPIAANGIVLGCIPNISLGCPVGTYFNRPSGSCVFPGLATNDTLAGFQFDEAMQCSRSDLPSGRYPGCPSGQAYDPSTGRCDIKNLYVDEGKVLSTVRFNYSAPSCEANNNNGGDGGDSGGAAPSCGSYGDEPSCSTAGCIWYANLNTCN